MERCFIAIKESKWLKDYNGYVEKAKQQRKFADKFFKEKGIDGQHYLISGDGMMNTPFEEFGKKNIRLSIEPTENNLDKFGKMISKVGQYGLCKFRKNSSINKELQQRCIDESSELKRCIDIVIVTAEQYINKDDMRKIVKEYL